MNLVDLVAEELAVIKRQIFGKINDSSDIKRKFDRPTKTNRVLASKIDYSSENELQTGTVNIAKWRTTLFLLAKFSKKLVHQINLYSWKNLGYALGAFLRTTCLNVALKNLHARYVPDHILRYCMTVIKKQIIQEAQSSSNICENSENSTVCSATNYDGTRKKKVIYPYDPVRVKTTHNSKDVIVNCAIYNSSSDFWISKLSRAVD